MKNTDGAKLPLVPFVASGRQHGCPVRQEGISGVLQVLLGVGLGRGDGLEGLVEDSDDAALLGEGWQWDWEAAQDVELQVVDIDAIRQRLDKVLVPRRDQCIEEVATFDSLGWRDLPHEAAEGIPVVRVDVCDLAKVGLATACRAHKQ